jgi:NAD(P)-dependent dehydrogenase (short-subunit alcohol dehydrogenase family)
MHNDNRGVSERVLVGQAALVTGGSQGLGRALGGALAAAGARVVLVARHEGPLAATVAEIRAAGGEAHAVVADVADKDAAAVIAGQAAALVGPIDLLINNASTLGPVPLRLLLDTDCEDLERALAVNLVGAFRLTKALAGPMLLRGAGTIVNVTSDAATEPYERWGAYGASKAALEQLGRVWAAELAGTGVRLFTVDPGEMDTRMHADAIPDANRAELSDPARVAERIVALVAGSDAASGARVAIRVGPSGASAAEAATR